MSDNIKDMRDHRRKKNPQTMKEAAEAAAQYIRNIGADKIKEPEGFASGGDMRKILEQADKDEDKGCDKDR